MKKTAISILMFLSFSNLHSQYVDSLHQALFLNKHDTDRVFTLLRLSNSYSDSERDSSMHFAQKALNLAIHNDFKKGEAQSLNIIGSILTMTGNYPKAFEYHLEALKIAEILKNETLIAGIFNNLARVSTERSDYKEALKYYFQARTKLDELGRHEYAATALFNIGDTYDRMNHHDSAVHFLNLAWQLAKKIDYSYLLAAIKCNLGHTCVTVGKTEEGATFFREALELLQLGEDKTDLETLAGVYEGISKIMELKGNYDSALYCAKQSFGISMQVSDQKRLLTAAKRLNQLYANQKLIDSAYRYSTVANEIREKILNEQKISQLEGLKFDEQLRQQELARLRENERKARINNLRLIGIILFIITFFAILLLLSRRKAHPKALKYLGLLGLLLVFEFIALFIHPYIDKWTGHHPVYMLIILVAVAACLVPVHHRLEHWVKEKLTRIQKARTGRKRA